MKMHIISHNEPILSIQRRHSREVAELRWDSARELIQKERSGRVTMRRKMIFREKKYKKEDNSRDQESDAILIAQIFERNGVANFTWDGAGELI